VLHCHGDWAHLPVLLRLGVPVITTLHGRLDQPGLPELIDTFPRAPFVSISDNQRRPLPHASGRARCISRSAARPAASVV
jgi:hypothetical protein